MIYTKDREINQNSFRFQSCIETTNSLQHHHIPLSDSLEMNTGSEKIFCQGGDAIIPNSRYDEFYTK
jgi:hypothetical protein